MLGLSVTGKRVCRKGATGRFGVTLPFGFVKIEKWGGSIGWG